MNLFSGSRLNGRSYYDIDHLIKEGGDLDSRNCVNVRVKAVRMNLITMVVYPGRKEIEFISSSFWMGSNVGNYIYSTFHHEMKVNYVYSFDEDGNFNRIPFMGRGPVMKEVWCAFGRKEYDSDIEKGMGVNHYMRFGIHNAPIDEAEGIWNNIRSNQ